MTKTSCQNTGEHSDLHACQLQGKESNPKIDEIFKNPRYVCDNCGAKTRDEINLCQPKPL